MTGQYHDEYRCKNPRQNYSKQTESNNILKSSYTMIKSGLFQDARILQYTQINQCDTPHQQIER